MEALGQILKIFEKLIKRALIPSISFYFILIVEYFLFHNHLQQEIVKQVTDIMKSIQLDNFIVLISLIMFIGLSLVLSILNQIIFDNNLKKNYNGLCSITENTQLDELRKKVIQLLEPELNFIHNNSNDYLLYQVIGRQLSYLKQPTHIHRYVDDAKITGIVFISIILVNFLLFCNFLSFVIFAISLFIGHHLIKAKYRSRAIRLYVNYLLEVAKNSKEYKC